MCAAVEETAGPCGPQGRRRENPTQVCRRGLFWGESETPALLLKVQPADQEQTRNGNSAWQARRAHLNLSDSAYFKNMPVLASVQEALLQTIGKLKCSSNPKRCPALRGVSQHTCGLEASAFPLRVPVPVVLFLKPLPTRTTASPRPTHAVSAVRTSRQVGSKSLSCWMPASVPYARRIAGKRVL